MSSRRSSRESGFALLLVFAMAAAIAVMLFTQMPRAVFEAERDREERLVQIGHEYQRAIQLQFRKTRKLPQNMDELEKMGTVRYLRRRYVDPMTGKDDWRVIHMDNLGQLTDSLTNKKKDDKDKNAPNSFITEAPHIGDTPGSQPGTPDVARRVRPSDRSGYPAGLAAAMGGEGKVPVDSYGVPVTNPGLNPQGYPGSVNPAGYPTGAGVPGSNLPPGYPVGSGTPGVSPPAGYSNLPPGYPVGSGTPGSGLPPGYPVGSGIPGRGSTYPTGGVSNSQTGGTSGGISVLPGLGGGGSGAGSGYPQGTPGTPAAGNYPNPGQPGYPNYPAPGYPTPGSGVNPGTGNGDDARIMIQNLLTTPKTGGLQGMGGGAMVMTGGIAGIASKFEADGIKIVNERSKIQEWEFIYDPKKDTGGKQATGVQAQNGQQGAPGTGPGSNSSGFGNSNQSSFGNSGSSFGNSGGSSSSFGQSGSGFGSSFPNRQQ